MSMHLANSLMWRREGKDIRTTTSDRILSYNGRMEKAKTDF